MKLVTGRRWVYPIIATAMLGGLVGCGAGGNSGPPTAHLTGQVTIDGEAIPSDAEGTIDFHPVGGGQAHPASAPIEGGRYDCPSVPMGEVMVLFNITRLTGRMTTEAGGNPFPERENLVPADVQQGVTIQVEGDAQRDFDL